MLVPALRYSTLLLLVAGAHPCGESAQAQDLLTSTDWSQLRALHEVRQHEITETANGFETRNPRHGWSVQFDGRGVLIRPDGRDWNWGLELSSYGFANNDRQVGSRACSTATDGRVTYEWDETCEEWYINDAQGLEHGYTLRERPTWTQRNDTEDQPGMLTLKLNVRGGLAPLIQEGLKDVLFVDPNGRAVLSYSGLVVFDAEGTLMPSRFELQEGRLVLLIDEREARYPLTIDPTVQEAYIKASNTGSGDRFGQSLSLSGDTLAVAGHFEDSNATGVGGSQTDNSANNSGAVYVFVRTGSTWTQEAYIKASNSGSFDLFGWKVDLSGDTLAVGAISEDSNATGIGGNESDNTASASGAVYIFTRTGSTWSQEAYIKASNTRANDGFGVALAISGDTLIVGAPDEDSNATGVGGNESDDTSNSSGAAYVFVRNGSTWSQEAYLKASNTEPDDRFGLTVSLSGDIAVVGAAGEDSNATGPGGTQSDNSASDSGAAYVFARSGTTWIQQSYLKPFNTEAFDNFGVSLDLFGTTVIVGAPGEDSNATGTNGDPSDNSAPQSGAAYVFARAASSWTQLSYLKASNSEANDRFGQSVAITDGLAAVSADLEDSNAGGIDGDQTNNTESNSGAVYLIAQAGLNWTQVAYIKASTAESADLFGSAVALSGNLLAVGATGEDSDATDINGDEASSNAPGSGAAYAFDIDLTPPPPPGLCFGDGGNQTGCTNCPCGNQSPVGAGGGCLNSAAGSAILVASGSPSVSLPAGSTSDLRFSLRFAPPNTMAILNSADAVAPGNMQNPCFGMQSGGLASAFDGLRCAISNTRRMGTRAIDSAGDVGNQTPPWGGEGLPDAGLAQARGGLVAGQTRYFQVIYTDDPLAVCARGLNTSQAIEITFEP